MPFEVKAALVQNLIAALVAEKDPALQILLLSGLGTVVRIKPTPFHFIFSFLLLPQAHEDSSLRDAMAAEASLKQHLLAVSQTTLGDVFGCCLDLQRFLGFSN